MRVTSVLFYCLRNTKWNKFKNCLETELWFFLGKNKFEHWFVFQNRYVFFVLEIFALVCFASADNNLTINLRVLFNKHVEKHLFLYFFGRTGLIMCFIWVLNQNLTNTTMPIIIIFFKFLEVSFGQIKTC